MPSQKFALAKKLLEVLDKDPKALLDLVEAKHLANHGGAPHRDRWVSKHHKRYPDKKAEKEKKKSKQAFLAAAALASLIAMTNKRLLANLFNVGSLRNKIDAADARRRAQFKSRMDSQIAASKKMLADSYRKSYLYGLQSTGMPVRFGATKTLSNKEKLWLEDGLKQELKFFDGLAAEIKAGRNVATLASRIKMYADALASAYSAGQVVGSSEETLISWNLSPDAHHCADCLEIAKHSPFTKDTLPTQPKSGWCVCKSNCKCTLSFEPASKEVADRVRKTAPKLSYWRSRLVGLRKSSR